ncbi:MAG: Hpt domain-containing protein, partial [Acidobacteriaceae bacterium]
MTVEGNIDQFRLSFREEARELLVELESGLLELNEQREDEARVGQVFRALHTLKGSGAMFGFDELAAFAHKLENAFDEVRKGRLAVTPELVDLTLTALDQIRAMVEEVEGKSQVDRAACAEILAQVRALTGTTEDPAPTGEAEAPRAELETPAEDGAEQRWHVHFAPGEDLMRNGADPLLLMRELAGLGRLTATASMAGVPPLAQLEPERCYVSWDMELVTVAGEDAIRDVFIFVEDTCELTLTAAQELARPEPVPEKISPACAADRIAKGLEEKRRSPGRRASDQPDAASS